MKNDKFLEIFYTNTILCHNNANLGRFFSRDLFYLQLCGLKKDRDKLIDCSACGSRELKKLGGDRFPFSLHVNPLNYLYARTLLDDLMAKTVSMLLPFCNRYKKWASHSLRARDVNDDVWNCKFNDGNFSSSFYAAHTRTIFIIKHCYYCIWLFNFHSSSTWEIFFFLHYTIGCARCQRTIYCKCSINKFFVAFSSLHFLT